MAHYVNNEHFLQAIKDYKKELETNPEARVPEYIGQCILDIAKRFASRPNFYGYSYKEELVSDGIENCLQYLTNFDPDKSSNPFAYYTQICYYAFIRRIAREKKQSYIKHKLIQDMPFEAFDQQEFDDAELSQSFMSFVQTNNSFDFESYERKIDKKSTKKATKTPIEELMESDDEQPTTPCND